LLQYLGTTQKVGIERLKTVDNYTDKQYMHLSAVTRANLELTQTMRGKDKKGTLLWVLDKTQTAMGKRLIRSFIEQPLVQPVLINQRLSAVEEMYKNALVRGEVTEILSKIFDIERLLTRVVYGNANPREVYALAVTIEKLPCLKEILNKLDNTQWQDISNRIDLLQDVKMEILNAINPDSPISLKEGGVILSGFSAEVDELRDIVHGGKDYLAQLETKLKAETGISKLKIGYNRVFGYYIEVTQAYLSQVPETFIRKQTLANAERYITEELKQLESKILGANERLVILERDLFETLLTEISKNATRIQSCAVALAQADVFTGLAQVAVKNNYVKPTVNNSNNIYIKEGRHPVIEKMLNSSLFVPNDTCLDCDKNKMLIITGPNMA
ncbi:MAG: DNA mismatch repair protein MutS, partial [Oscillospiraceae bacterium]